MAGSAQAFPCHKNNDWIQNLPIYEHKTLKNNPTAMVQIPNSQKPTFW